jgi:hypothetical protein
LRYETKHIVTVMVLSVLVFFGFHRFTKSIYSDEINLTVHLKMYNNAGVRLFYSTRPNEYLLKQSDLQLMFASQYYKGITFKIPEINYTKYLRLDLGDVANEVFIQRVELSVNNVTRNEIVGSWEGAEISKIIRSYNDASLQAQNSGYMQIAGGSVDPYLLLNDVPGNVLKEYYDDHGTGNTAQIVASILLSLFLIAVIIYFVPRVSVPRFSEFVRRGGVLITGGILIIAAVFINNKFGFISDRGNNENRTLAAQPELTLRNFFIYPDLFTAYAKDNFAFRNHLFYLHSRYVADFFKESPMPEDALLGREGWFYDNEQGGINDYRGITKISQGELAQISKSIYERKKWLDDRGIKFYIIIPPNKHSVYPEYLPNGFFETQGIGENRLKVYKQHLEKYNGISLVDPTDALKEAKKFRDVYYKTDTHWNLYGGFIGYRELMKQISKDFPFLKPAEESDFHITSFYSNEGDLAKVAGLNDDFRRLEISLSFKDTSKHLTMPSGSEIVLDYDNTRTIDGSRLKLLMLRDSYSNYLIPFINLHFQKAKYLWTYDFPDKIIEQEKPDVVIFESLQRFMAGAFAIPNPTSLDTATKLVDNLPR